MENVKKIEALRKLKEAGIRTAALLCPVVPYITDAIQLIEMLAPYTDVIWIYGRGFNDRSDQNWLNMQKIISCEFPDLLEQVESAVFSKKDTYWEQHRGELVKTQRCPAVEYKHSLAGLLLTVTEEHHEN